MNSFPEGKCEVCQKLTRLRCHCHKWGYEEMYFCSADCRSAHLQDHQYMQMKRPLKDGAPDNVSKRPNIVLSSFSIKETCGKSSNKSEESVGTSTAFLQPKKSNLVENAIEVGDENQDQNPVQDAADQNPVAGVTEKKPVEGDGGKSKRGPLISLSKLTHLQKARKTNTYLKLLKGTVAEMQMFRPRWRFQLKTESTNGDAGIKKRDMNFTFERIEDRKPENVAHHVKRRWTKALKCIKAVEALRPDLIFDLSTDKPQGTGMATAHQYHSEVDREPIDVIEDPDEKEDDIDVAAVEVVQEENEDDEMAVGDNVEKEIGDECRICKQVAFEEGGQVMLYCGTNKKVLQHYGCHITCMGLVRINIGDKLLSDIRSHYRCPDHMD